MIGLVLLLFVVIPSLSCVQLCNPMDCSMPASPVLHCLPELAQIHVHRGDTVQPSHSLSPVCPQSFPAPGSFLRRWLFASGGQSTGALAPRALDPALVSPRGHLAGTPGCPLQRCPSAPCQLRHLFQRPPQASLPRDVTASSPTVSRTALGAGPL